MMTMKLGLISTLDGSTSEAFSAAHNSEANSRTVKGRGQEPEVAAWWKRMASRPAARKAYPPLRTLDRLAVPPNSTCFPWPVTATTDWEGRPGPVESNITSRYRNRHHRPAAQRRG